MKIKMLLPLLIGVLTAFSFLQLPWMKDIDLYFYDNLLASTTHTAQDQGIIVVGIDDKSLEQFSDPLILWHKYLAKVISGISEAGAKAIALDIIPTISLDKLAPELDRQFIRAMRQSHKNGTPLYLGFTVGENGQLPHRKYLFAASGLGFLNLSPDSDGKVRRQTLTIKNDQGQEVGSAALLMANAINQDIENLPSKIYIDYRHRPPPIISFAKIYDHVKNGDVEALTSQFKEKVVIIGVTSQKLPDTHTAPVTVEGLNQARIPGSVIHAFTAQTILSNKYITKVQSGYVWLITLILALGSGFLSLKTTPLKAVTLIIVALLATFYVIATAFSYYCLIPATPLITALVIPGLITGSFRYVQEYRQFRTLQRYFKSYVNPEIMKEIIEKPDSVSFEGDHITCTVMFTDIRSFTTLSEQISPRKVVTGLNRYFSEMTNAVTEMDGYLNKYLGDGILAIFGAPNKLPNDGAMAAIECGMKMLERLDELNKSEIFPGIDEVRIGVGIHTGEAVVGNIGCDKKMEYSIIGDTVNLAARIESVTKQYKLPMLISEDTYKRVKDHVEVQFVASAKVKGREQEVKLYEVLSAGRQENSDYE